MTARKAKRHMNEAEDFLVISKVKGIIYVDTKDNDSVNIIGDLAVANKDFRKYLKEILKAIESYEKETD
jgi:hypothetical protein